MLHETKQLNTHLKPYYKKGEEMFPREETTLYDPVYLDKVDTPFEELAAYVQGKLFNAYGQYFSEHEIDMKYNLFIRGSLINEPDDFYLAMGTYKAYQHQKRSRERSLESREATGPERIRAPSYYGVCY